MEALEVAALAWLLGVGLWIGTRIAGWWDR